MRRATGRRSVAPLIQSFFVPLIGEIVQMSGASSEYAWPDTRDANSFTSTLPAVTVDVNLINRLISPVDVSLPRRSISLLVVVVLFVIVTPVVSSVPRKTPALRA